MVVIAFSVAALMLAGFLAGWVVFRPDAEEISRTGATTVEESTPPPTQPEVPEEDVPGAEVPGLDRYPGSVRTEYRREHIRDLIVTEAEYMAAADVDAVREFYRELFHKDGWSVGDLGFFQGEWVFFVIRGDHEAIVEITDQGETVEIELELSELSPDKQDQQTTPPEQQAPADPAPQPEPSPQAPAQPAPQPAPAPAPAPAPPPADDDDGYDYDDDFDDDDGFDSDD